ncbi:MAG: glyoxalase [Arachnia propionica]|uniref:glyoxalase n=1 Tax=Arachnia propionica TaxID=1750 RepID=UPI002702492F|nr:glyoxalase [Arachnia propionica]
MAPAIHHIELWTTDLETSRPQFDWLLTSLGWASDPVPGWDEGMIWRAATGEYLVLEQSPAVSGPLDRMHAGLNHLALTTPDRDLLDRLRDEAPHRGWTHLFPDRYPHAGGPDSTALYLENTEGFEVEIVVPSSPSHPC